MRWNFDGFSGGDRTRIELPAVQLKLLQALRASGKPVVFVNCSGSAVAMPWAAKHLPAIVQAWYPGQWADAPWPKCFLAPRIRPDVCRSRSTIRRRNLPAFDDYSMSNRTYRYFKGQPLFAFGHGLSYTRFQYNAARLDTARSRRATR